MNTTPKNHSSRSGIALVIVLGFLVAMAMLAVGFSIYMRTERLAGKGYLDAVRARHFVDVALARAMDDVDFQMADKFLVYPTNKLFVSSGYAEPNLQRALTNDNVLTFFSDNFTGQKQTALNNAGWSNIYVNSELAGRYAYIVDGEPSGMLDINWVGPDSDPAPARGFGLSPRDIRIDSSLVALTNAHLVANRTAWRRFETPREIEAAFGVGSGALDHFHSFSRFPPRRGTTVTNQPLTTLRFTNDLINIGLNAAGLQADQANIVAALTRAGITNAAAVFENLLDYVDNDDNPRSLTSFCTEAVPMINEVVVSNRVVTASGTNTVHIYLTVETWFPFPNPPAGAFTLSVPAPTFSVAGSAFTMSNTPAASSVNISPTAYGYATSFVSYASAPTPVSVNGVEVKVSYAAPIKVQRGGADVDQTSLTMYTINVGAAPVWRQAKDPRLNWDQNISSHWINDSPNPSLGAANAGINDIGERPSRMFVRNGPIENVAELGFLSVGQPWQTIALYPTADGRGINPVLDLFYTPQHTNATNTVSGLFNPNSSLGGKLLPLIFKDAPAAATPTNTTPVLNDTKYGEIKTAATALYATGPFQYPGISWVGQVVRNVGTDDAEREMVLGAAHRLLNPRQNVFTGILIAQAVSPMTNVLAEQKAAVIFWRDPFEENGRNRMFVRFFRWIDE